MFFRIMKTRPSSAVRLVSILLLPITFLTGWCLTGETLELNDDVLGLIVLKSGLQDPSKYLDSWNEDDESPCAWRFVKCNPINSRVSQLSLDGLSLSGKIGRGLEKLQLLKSLSLSNNNLTGTINPDLALLPKLQTLNLSRNTLSGSIYSSLSNISTLRFLDLSQNTLSGPLPDNMFERNSCSLRHLSLAGNRLDGPIPSTFSKCTRLHHLNLSDNHFSGNPCGIWSLTRLRILDLSNNALSESVPVGISFFRFLKELVLHGNQFSGSLPDDIGMCPHLTRIDFSNNFLTGTIPESLQNLNALTSLSLSNNFLTGDFPLWVGKMNSLEYFDLSNNHITGILPTSIGDLKLLKYLALSNNKLSGAIPHSLSDCPSLSVIRLRGNGFNGSIPDGLFSMKLDEMDLSRNNLRGFHIRAALGLSSSKLRCLNLSWNYLETRVPPEFGYFRNLTVLDIRNSGLIGLIPGDICVSGSLAILQLDGNSLSGPIPHEIGNCSSLYLLSLSHNNLSGPIPDSMSLLSKLKILKLEVNHLSGEMPRELVRLENLLVANMSYNRLVGRLPAGGIFQNLDASAIEGNLGICSPMLKGPCMLNVPKPLVLNPYAYGNRKRGNQHSSGSSTKWRHHNILSVSAIVAISAAAIIAFGVLVISFLNALARRRMAFVDNSLESMCSSPTRSSNLVAGELILIDSKSTSPDLRLTASFDSVLNKAAEIGEGVFGTVYRASLGGHGQPMLAIKKLVTTNTLECQEEFDREVRFLGKARHPNLIPLRGYYWTPQLQILVSDYSVKGSLQTKLHEPSTFTSSPLTWLDRFKIVLGTAKGLAHLHHSFRPPIVHHNIKPSNILLDENLNPKISDFGLASLLTKLDKHVVSNRFQSAPGYVAPELACESLRVDEKCDVYGFGVLILEVVTGRRPVEFGEDNVVGLSDHVRVLLEQGNVLDWVDTRMGKYPEEEVLPVIKLALVCASQIPSSRPSMAEVVQVLQVIKTPLPNRKL
ncbi:hypothetical protein OROHE_002795 [Orobanche hederae]